MKPTLSNIERRLEALENAPETQDMEPLTIILNDGTDNPEIFVLSHPNGKPKSETFRGGQGTSP